MEGPGLYLGIRLVVRQSLDLKSRQVEEGLGLTMGARLVEGLGWVPGTSPLEIPGLALGTRPVKNIGPGLRISPMDGSVLTVGVRLMQVGPGVGLVARLLEDLD